MALAPRPPPEYLLTTSIAAYRLGVCRRTILRYIHAGTIPATRYPGGQWRVSAAAIAKIQTTTRSI